ncbi:hypothetical protein J437_LFUL018225 [Ladona fulva]|uniref:Uncharacterized protein n=1 Tax=Ladona fulva TaxID=123851 RepID=A0A8K0KS77_LADFU|nr:hypothetical protein J437_LFUL018225 [Ladona fulva]
MGLAVEDEVSFFEYSKEEREIVPRNSLGWTRPSLLQRYPSRRRLGGEGNHHTTTRSFTEQHLNPRHCPNHALSMELAYVTERIIALWFPSLENDTKETNEEKAFEEATSMLRVKHAENCMVFDLSTLDESQEHTSHYLGWQGPTLAPPLERLCSACKYIESWLSSNPQHVAVLFARGPCSKERIGVIISAYLTYSGICGSEEQALDRFAMRRFFQDKIGHLTSPSSVRYVGHFSGLLSGGIRMNAEPLFLKYITVCGTPEYKTKNRSDIQDESVCFFLKIYQQGLSLVYTSPVYELSLSSERLTIGVENTRTYPVSSPLHLRGDVLLKGYRLCRDLLCPQRCLSNSLHRHSVFQCQFHTCAVAKSSLCFPRAELDEGEDHKDNGNLELHFYSRKEASENSPLRLSDGSFSSALYLPYADEDEEQAVVGSVIAHDSMEELCSKRRAMDTSNIESAESWANGVLDEDQGLSVNLKLT